MTKREFIGHMFCETRFKQLTNKIKYAPIEYVMDLYDLHLSVPRNVRYNQLQKLFDERLNS